jgi:Tfp pilus assembly protein PilN
MRPVNLLPESQRRRRPTGEGNGAYVAIGVLATLLVMTLGYVVTANNATSRANEAAVASAEADRLEARAAELGAFGNFAQIKEARLASVRDLADTRFDWERLVRELSRVLPKNGWLQNMKASTTGEDDAADPAAAAAPVGAPSANLTGCMPHQSDVADLMVRLRRMHRVEDVTLKESVIDDLSSPPTVDSCGDFYKFDVTAVFAPAVSEEKPDGRSRVPASLGGGS